MIQNHKIYGGTDIRNRKKDTLLYSHLLDISKAPFGPGATYHLLIHVDVCRSSTEELIITISIGRCPTCPRRIWKSGPQIQSSTNLCTESSLLIVYSINRCSIVSLPATLFLCWYYYYPLLLPPFFFSS